MTYAEDYVKRLQQIRFSGVYNQTLDSTATNSDFANLILQKARSDWSTHYSSGPSEAKKQGGPSVKSFALGLLDKLSRPGYALANLEDVAFNKPGERGPGDLLKAAGRGFSGKEKTSFIDVLQHQHANEITKTPEYKDILSKYGQQEADVYAATEAKKLKKDKSDFAGGLLVDLVQDPLNLVGVGALTKPFKAVKELTRIPELSKLATESSDVTKAATKLSEAGPSTAQAPPGLSPDLLDKLKAARGQNTSEVDFPTVTGKFGSNRRPPVKTIEGQEVKADYSFAQNLQEQPRFANLTDVFNRDLRESDFSDLQRARIQNETAQIVHQTAQGDPAALDLLTNKNIDPLPPVAREHVDASVAHIVKEINDAIPNVAKAKAAGKQFRWQLNNAPTQNNLSNKLSTSVRKIFNAPRNVPADQIPPVFDHYLNMLRNSEESLITLGRAEKSDKYYPRGGIKPTSPYLRLSDVLATLPRQLAEKAIFGPGKAEKVLPSLLLKAVTGNNAALGKIARQNRPLFEAIQNTDWTPLMVKEYATRTIDSANHAKETTDSVAGFIAAKLADPNASDVDKAASMDFAVKTGKAAFKNEMPEAKSTLGEMLDGLKHMTNPTPDPIDSGIQAGKYKLAENVFSNSEKAQKAAQPARIATATATIEEVTGLSPSVAAVDISKMADAAENGIFYQVMKAIDPAFGYKDLRQLVLKNMSARKTSAIYRAGEVTKIFAKVPEAEHMAFWHEVTGTMPVTEAHAEAVANLQKSIENLFGDSGLAEHFAGNTAIARSGINVNHLNNHLRIVGVHDFKFVREVPDPLDPTKVVVLNPDQVLDTWKTYVPNDAKSLRKFAFSLSQAAENAMVEYSTFANLGALRGSKIAKAGYTPVVGMHPVIDGMYFPDDMVSQIGKMAQGIDDMYEPVANSQLMKLYDSALRTWKTMVTIPSPSHHIRNAIGDLFTAWLDGVNDPMYYTKSGQMLRANWHRYSDIKTGKNPLSDILGQNVESDVVSKIIGQTTERIPKGTRVLATAKIGGKNYHITLDQAYQMAFRQGIFPHSSVVEDLPGAETLIEKAANKYQKGKYGVFSPTGGKAAKAVRGASEVREHFIRGGHWLHALEHTKANSLEELFQKAGDRVRKYHPDGLDLTLTEKRVFRRLMPFYSWNRKAIPLIVEGVLTNPAKILAYPKVMSGIQESQGIESNTSNPWPDDALFPDWLASKSIGPVLPPDNWFAKKIARSPGEEGYTYINPGNPATDILEQYGQNPALGVASAFTPFIKLPVEMISGQQIQSSDRIPITDKTQYADQNIPGLSIASRLTHGAVGTGILEGGDMKKGETEPYNIPGLINYLSGAGIIDTGKYKKGAEFDLRDRLRKQKENAAK